MANCKEVDIRGWVPFNIVSRGDSDLYRWLAHFSEPIFGLKLVYTSRHRQEHVPETGGEYSFYEFQMTGVEALRSEFIEGGLKAMKRAGARFDWARIRDHEEDTAYWSVMDVIDAEDEIEGR